MRSTTIRLLIGAAAIAAVIGVPTASYAIQCAIYARAQTGVSLYGDAGAWWGEAAGRYLRGQEPTRGAILVFKSSSYIRHGHVAVVSRVVSRREILVDQANWVRGRVNHDMSVIDTSPENDWTSVRVEDIGSGTHGRENPTFGFVYPANAAPVIEVAGKDSGHGPISSVHQAAFEAHKDTRKAVEVAAVREDRRSRASDRRELREARLDRHKPATESRTRVASTRERSRAHERLAAAKTVHAAGHEHLAAAERHDRIVAAGRHQDKASRTVAGHVHLAAARAGDRLHSASTSSGKVASNPRPRLHVALNLTQRPAAKPPAPMMPAIRRAHSPSHTPPLLGRSRRVTQTVVF